MRVPAAIICLFLLSILGPFGIFGIAATFQHRAVVAEARRDTEVTISVVRQVTQHLFETQELILELATAVTAGRDDADIARPEVRDQLAALSHRLPQTVSLWISDARGAILATSQPGARDNSVAHRDFFAAQRDGVASPFVGAPHLGRYSQREVLTLSSRRTAPDGRFAGTVHIAVSVDHVEEAFRDATGLVGGAAILLRQDGTVLVEDRRRVSSHPMLPPIETLRATAARSGGGVVEDVPAPDGVPLLFAYRSLDSFPVLVAYGADLRGRLDEWRRLVQTEAILAFLAATGLFAATWMAWRAAAAETTAVVALRQEEGRRAKAETRLRESEALEALGRMARGVAHDLNTLLTVVLGHLERLEDFAGDPMVRDAAGRARGAASAGAALSSNLLAYARTQVLRVERVSVTAFLLELRPVLQDLAHPSEVALDLPARPLHCRTDVVQLRAALGNLVTNARDATRGSGRIVITARPVLLGATDLGDGDAARPGRFVAFSVTDTGHGMTKAVVDRVFDPFFTTKAVGSGSGLGLSQVFGLMRQLGGKVALRSAVGEGTSATLYLPAAEAAPAEEVQQGGMVPDAAASSPVPALAEAVLEAPPPSTILVVDDQQEIRELMRRNLAHAGYVVVTAGGGEEALGLLRDGQRFDLLLSDVVMPDGLDGISLMKRVRETLPSIPVVLMSGYAPDAADLSASSVGFLAKPFTRKALLETVRKELA